jgi:hypothetical protein
MNWPSKPSHCGWQRKSGSSPPTVPCARGRSTGQKNVAWSSSCSSIAIASNSSLDRPACGEKMPRTTPRLNGRIRSLEFGQYSMPRVDPVYS